MKKTYIILASTLTLSLLLTACGGGGSSSSSSKGISSCVDSSGDQGLAKAKVIASGKSIHKTKDNTNIRLWHLKSGERKACIVSGSAEVI